MDDDDSFTIALPALYCCGHLIFIDSFGGPMSNAILKTITRLWLAKHTGNPVSAMAQLGRRR